MTQAKRFKKSLLGLCFCVWLSQGSTQTLPVDGAINGVHDPVMIAEDGKYYLFGTGPGVPIRCSDDMLNWTLCSAVFFGLPKWLKEEVPAIGDLWAPDISFYNGRYQLYYSGSSFGENVSAIGLATNLTLDPQSPDYNWQDEGLVIQSTQKDNWNAIDPNFIIDAEGVSWLTFGSFWSGIKIVKLDPETRKVNASEAALYDLASRPDSTAIEAPFIISRNGYYYLFTSFDQCCRNIDSTYNIRVGRSSFIMGPYVDKEGMALLEGGGSLVKKGGLQYKGPGHNAVFQNHTQDYLVYHAYDAQDHGISKLRIEPFYWQDDWPVFSTESE